MNTKRIGDISEGEITIALLKAGKNVLKPVGDNNRYDLVIEDSGQFFRVQCKTGKLINGSIRANLRSVYLTTNGTKVENYKGQIDFLAIYCPQVDKVYLVPETDIGRKQINLRIDESSGYNVRWAYQYELGRLPESG